MLDEEEERKRKNSFIEILNTKKERKDMLELAREFIGKECYVYLFGDTSYVRGKLISVSDSGVVIQNKNGKEIVNLQFIIRIVLVEK